MSWCAGKKEFVTKLSTGVANVVQAREGARYPGWARFTDAKTCTVEHDGETVTITAGM